MTVEHSLLTDSGDDPLVTIAIPTFNRASWLKDCVLSALVQSCSRFEVLVSDNASTDETQDVLKQFSDPRLRVVKQKSNIGLLPNWNACLAEAKGDYIVFLSDDDRIAPFLLERCMALVRLEPKIVVAIALSDIYSPAAGQIWPAAANRKLETGVWDGTDILLEILKFRIIPAMSCTMIETRMLRARGGFPVDFPYAGSSAAWAPLLLMGKAGFVNESCGSFCSHAASETSRLAIDVRLNDDLKVAELIASTAEGCIKDSQMRRIVKLEAKRFFARCAAGIMIAYREGGATLSEVFPLIWKWRRELSHLGIAHVVRMSRPLVIFILPHSVANWSRRFKRTYRGALQRAFALNHKWKASGLM